MPHIDRRSLARFYGWLRHIKTWQLVVILVIASVVSASLLRMNNIRMDTLRSQVQVADKEGDAAKIQQSLVDLQQYVAHHMNTSLGSGIDLVESYNRARDEALRAATSETNPNAAVYQQASVECQKNFVNTGAKVYSSEYVACVVNKLHALGAGSDGQPSIVLPRAEDYHYNFVSAAFSLDLAGASVAICLLITSVIVMRVVTAVALRFILRHRFKSI